jgi:hypothetical protein
MRADESLSLSRYERSLTQTWAVSSALAKFFRDQPIRMKIAIANCETWEKVVNHAKSRVIYLNRICQQKAFPYLLHTVQHYRKSENSIICYMEIHKVDLRIFKNNKKSFNIWCIGIY